MKVAEAYQAPEEIEGLLFPLQAQQDRYSALSKVNDVF